MRKLTELRRIIRGMGSCVVAYSGGVDSTFLAKVCRDELGKKAVAAMAVTPFVSEDEQNDAREFAGKIGIQLRVVRGELPTCVMSNPANRCYLCKKEIFKELLKMAKRGRLAAVIDGSNADDLRESRPGARALKELGVRSPLQEAGLVKEEIRGLSRRFGLASWKKPAYTCLATRFKTGEKLTWSKLRMVEKAEAYLRRMGFRLVRVRFHEGMARIEVDPKQLAMLLREGRKINIHLESLGFGYVTVDLKGYRSGSMTETWKNPR